MLCIHKSAFHLSELVGQAIPFVMRISLFIECPVRSVNSLKISMGLMSFKVKNDTLKKKSLFHFQKEKAPLVQIIQSVPFN